MNKTKWFGVIIAFAVVASLAIIPLVSACAPAAPTSEVPEQVEFETREWEPATVAAVGPSYDGLCYMADYMNRMSNGRLIVTPIAPGITCTVEEAIDAVASGLIETTLAFSSYYEGKIPSFFFHAGSAATVPTVAETRYLYEEYEDGRIEEIYREEYAKYGDIAVAGAHHWWSGTIMIGKVPIRGIADLPGLKIRSFGHMAKTLDKLGASTVWLPGPEIYTALATGAIDATTWGGPNDMIAMSFQEVTKYWVKNALFGYSCNEHFIVNGNEWRSLPEDLQEIVSCAIDAASGWSTMMSGITIARGWLDAKEAGMEEIYWSEEDVARLQAVQRENLDRYVAEGDAVCEEIGEIVTRFMTEQGYW